MFEVSVSPLSTVFLLHYGAVPRVVFFVFYFIIHLTFVLLFAEIVCDPISLNLSQHVTSINKGKSSYDFLENVTVTCKPGFKGQSTTSKCTDVNKWSGTTPICTSKCLILNISHAFED